MHWYISNRTLCLGLFAAVATMPLRADPLPDDSPLKTGNYLSKRPFTSVRGEALSGVLTGWADGSDAFYDNPAGIGGLDPKRQPKDLSQLSPIALGVAANENAQKILPRLRSANEAKDNTLTEEILSESQNKVEYARASFVPNMIYRRLYLGFLYDSQVVLAPRENRMMDMQQQTDQGPLIGFSGEGSKGLVRLGLSAAMINRTFSSAQLPYDELLPSDSRKKALNDYTKNYRGERYNLGLLITPKFRKLPLSFSLSAKDLGHTRLRPSREGDDELIISQQIDSSAQLSFLWEGSLAMNIGLAATDISSKWVKSTNKFATGMELNYGERPGSLSGFGLQTSYSYRGVAFGSHINLSVVRVEYASYPVDVGTSQESLIERRHAGILSFNVAEK